MPNWSGGLQELEPQWLLVGSALIALGVTTILAAVLAAWKSRPRRAQAPGEAQDPPVADAHVEAPGTCGPEADRLARELALLDRRLEDVERLVTGLSRRLDAATVATHPSASAAVEKPAPAAAAPPRRSAEHEALRALAGRA